MNCWASTTPYRTTTAVENISDRAHGYNMPGVIVDGQNVFEVYAAAKEAVERARRGEGPTFIEIFHRTDPLKLFKDQCPEGIVFTQEELDGILTEARAKVASAKEYAISCEYPEESEFYKDVYVD